MVIGDPMRQLIHRLRSPSRLDPVPTAVRAKIQRINARRERLSKLSDDTLRTTCEQARGELEEIAVTAEVARRTIGLDMFDIQIQGALALLNGGIAEMQTGEGKTLAAVPAIFRHAKRSRGVHVMTANDYLARRDANWMGPIFSFLGLTVGCIQQGMTRKQRHEAYSCSITYTTANEVGFDYLRDQLALYPSEQIQRPFAVAVVDEADSILIDEARLPLVIAGGATVQGALAARADEIARQLRPTCEYRIDEHGHNVSLTDDGVAAVERAFGCGNLFRESNLPLHIAIQNSLHAHALLRCDVDYVVKDGSIELVDEFKGRIASDRRWPASLQTAIEVKEQVAVRPQGSILGSITLQNLIALYPQVCGMTGTAATQREEFRSIYALEVEVIPTHRPMIRVDQPDVVFPTKREKHLAVVEEIRCAYATGRPVLVGSASVEESEQLSAMLGGIPHQVLNARDDEREAAIIERAGERGAVTVSTNMAGRGIDIQLGNGVAQLGGLYVIGMNKHESRRIDNQLRGRAGRQGDPGSSRFFISLEDDLLVRYGINLPEINHDPNSVQRSIEEESLDIRRFLHQYEGVVEKQRQSLQRERQEILLGTKPRASETERQVAVTTIDDLWSEHLAFVAEQREGIHWVSLGGREPLHEFLKNVCDNFDKLRDSFEEEVARRMANAKDTRRDLRQRSATWTYLTNDRPFGSGGERIFAGIRRKYKARKFWG